MDEPKYSTLMDAVVDIPDPRKARGKRHPWPLLLTLISAALLSGQRTGRAIGQWVTDHKVELLTRLPIPQKPLPSTSTLRRALRTIDVTALEERLAQFTQTLQRPPPVATAPWQAKLWMAKPCAGRRATATNCSSSAWSIMAVGWCANKCVCATRATRSQRCRSCCRGATYRER